MKDIQLFSSKTQKSIAKQVLIGFASVILAGSIILSLPQMTVTGDLSYIDALFTEGWPEESLPTVRTISNILNSNYFY